MLSPSIQDQGPPPAGATGSGELQVTPGANGRSNLVGFVNREIDEMSRFRTTIKLKDRLLNCARMREGRYDASTLAEINKLGGSAVYARIVSNKVRGSYAILSEVFTQGERPWAIHPTPVPTMPDDIEAAVKVAVEQETLALQEAGEPVPPDRIAARVEELRAAAQEASVKVAKLDAEKATKYLDDILIEGGFYSELRLFLMDFCTYPVAILQGPVAVMKTKVSYVNGVPTKIRQPVLEFRRVNPHDLLWSPGAQRIEDAATVLRQRLTRGQIAAMVGLPGYDTEAIRSALEDYADGFSDTRFYDQERAEMENQENPSQDSMIDVLTYTGALPGWMIEEDFEIAISGEPDFDALLSVTMIGRYVVMVSVDPDPRVRVPFFCAAYEAIPDSIAGSALPELIEDLDETCNATLRAMINNLSFAAGPQVVVDVARLAPDENPDVMFPWKRWRVISDPAMAAQKPIDFFQPSSNVGELQQVFSFLSALGDEVSAIPRYLTGNERVGGAGRTASGLSMLMSNASRSMVSIAQSIDINVLEPLLWKLYDLVLLTTGIGVLRGDESIQVKGATYAQTRETDRMRLLEFLQLTNNPIDLQIMGLQGRAAGLRQLAKSLGLDGEKIVPTDQELAQMQQQQQQAQQAALEQQGGVSGGPRAEQPPGQQGPQPQKSAPNQTAQETDNAHRTRSQTALQPGRKAN